MKTSTHLPTAFSCTSKAQIGASVVVSSPRPCADPCTYLLSLSLPCPPLSANCSLREIRPVVCLPRSPSAAEDEEIVSKIQQKLNSKHKPAHTVKSVEQLNKTAPTQRV